MDANLREITAEMRPWRNETMAFQETTEEVYLESKEPTSVKIGSVVMHEEVPKEEASIRTVRALK
jgi:hypothetical protein